MFVEPWKFLFAALVPLALAGWEDAKTREVSFVYPAFIFLLALGLNVELFLSGNTAFPLMAVAFSFLIAVIHKLKPSFLPQGDVWLFFSLAFLLSINFSVLLALNIMFSLLYNTIKRRPFNSPLPVAPFLFISLALINAFVLFGLYG